MNALVPTALLVAFMWASSGIIQKLLLRDMSPEFALIIVGLTYGIILLAYGAIDARSNIQKLAVITSKQWIGIIAIAFLGIFVSTLIWYKLLAKHEAFRVNTLTSTGPLFTLLLAALFLNENIDVKSAIGVLLIVCGIILIGYHQNK